LLIVNDLTPFPRRCSFNAVCTDDETRVDLALSIENGPNYINASFIDVSLFIHSFITVRC